MKLFACILIAAALSCPRGIANPPNNPSSQVVTHVTDQPGAPDFYYTFNPSKNLYTYVWLDDSKNEVIYLIFSKFGPTQYHYKIEKNPREITLDKLEIGGIVISK